MSSVFVEEAPDFAIRCGLVFITAKEDGSLRTVCTPLHEFRVGIAKANKKLAEYDAAKAPVVPIKKKDAHAA